VHVSGASLDRTVVNALAVVDTPSEAGFSMVHHEVPIVAGVPAVADFHAAVDSLLFLASLLLLESLLSLESLLLLEYPMHWIVCFFRRPP
jgi:hypothetical protein